MNIAKTFAIFLLILLSAPLTGQEKINWIPIDKLEEAMAKEPKKVLIDVYTKWCGPCRMMANNTFKNPEVVEYINEHYYAVKFNAEGNETFTFLGQEYKNPNYDPARANSRNGTHQFTMAIAPVNGRVAYPTIVYMNEKFQIISPVQGYMQPAQILPLLHFIVDEAYLKGVTYQDYVKSYNAKN